MVDKVEPPERAPVAKHPGLTRRTWTTADGRVQTRFDAATRGSDGRKVSKTFRTIGDAQRWLDEQRADVHRGHWHDPSAGAERFADFYSRWRERAAELGRPGARTLVEYDRNFRLWVAPKLGKRRVGSLTRKDVEAVVRAAATVSPWRAQDTLKLVRRLLSAALDEDPPLVVSNVASRVRAPAIPRKAPKIATRQQVAAIAEAMPERLRALVIVSAYCSLRFSEAVALRARRVDLAERVLHVEEAMVETGGQLIVGPPKTDRSRRAVAIPRNAADALAEHVAAFPPNGPDGLLFTAPHGGPIRRSHFGTAWRSATAAAGVAGFPVRNLRHSGAVWALEAGANPVLLSHRLGHVDGRMVSSTYSDLLDAADREIADALDADPRLKGRERLERGRAL